MFNLLNYFGDPAASGNENQNCAAPRKAEKAPPRLSKCRFFMSNNVEKISLMSDKVRKSRFLSLNKVENLICYVDKVENVDYNIKYKAISEKTAIAFNSITLTVFFVKKKIL